MRMISVTELIPKWWNDTHWSSVGRSVGSTVRRIPLRKPPHRLCSECRCPRSPSCCYYHPRAAHVATVAAAAVVVAGVVAATAPPSARGHTTERAERKPLRSSTRSVSCSSYRHCSLDRGPSCENQSVSALRPRGADAAASPLLIRR